ncbi:unnamed protein product [Knipowitschia caucasica]|uniref:Transthyretin n=1 Tax=Knipowitschia caucasica TaxID=637954 RepID=A0AAV2KVP4_KNICA
MAALRVLLLLPCLLLPTHTAPVAEKHGGSDLRCPLTVKILDAVHGTPAGPMSLRVFRRNTDETWTLVASG